MPTDILTTQRIIGALWVIWIAIWIAAAFGNKRTVYRQPPGQRIIYIAMGLVGYLIFRHTYVTSWMRLPNDPVTEAIGIGLCALGQGFSVWARIHLGRNWSGIVTLKENHELIQSGPYRLVRHPIYTGILTAIAGSFLALIPSPAALIYWLVLAGSFFIKLRQEEALMMKQFPEAYPAYKARVKALIPFLI